MICLRAIGNSRLTVTTGQVPATPGRYAIEIARRFQRREVPPALKRPPGPRLDQHELGLEHQITATDSRLVNERAHIKKPLPAKNLATDHPIKRPALAQLVGTPWRHASAMQVLA
jgi:hypothetical protein